MNYYLINNDAVSLGGLSRHDGWIRYGLAFTSGAMDYHEQFRQLAPGDIVLIYVNKLGVVAIGSVVGPWNSAADLIDVAETVPREESEHRIRVYWIRDLRSRPLSLEKLRVIIGWTPRQSVQQIRQGVERIQGLIADFQRNLDC